MKFLRVELENIFAYHGRVEIDLHMTTPERNIVLIWGRNGMGKTSLLKALKHLFRGVSREDDRIVGFPPKPLPTGQYVVGDGAGWSGLVNRPAFERDGRAGRRTVARVAATMEKDDGGTLRAERSWIVEYGMYEEVLVVVEGGERSTKEAAEDRLQDILPPEFVNFFFFDGEDIKSLAESEERKQVDFDRLLRISFVTTLADEVAKLATERRRRNLRGDHAQIDETAARLARAQRQKAQAAVELDQVEDALSSDTIDLRRLQTRRDNLTTGASESERQAIEARRRAIVPELKEAREDIAELVPASAPMLANPRLVEAALEAVDVRLRSANADAAVTVRRAKSAMPGWIAASPLGLEPLQVDALAAELSGRLDGLIDETATAGLFAGLDPARAERLREALNGWRKAGPDMLNAQSANLARAYRLQEELAQADEALMRLAVGSQNSIEQYRTISRSIVELEERIAEGNQKKGQGRNRLETAAAEEEAAARQLAALEAHVVVATRDAKEAKAFNDVVRALNELTELTRSAMREELQGLINERFVRITRHPLIQRIELDESYTMTFLRHDGTAVGRASLSSGLKQLAATALLWAMKDAAAEKMPVVIDTPLGRIDRENQNLMLQSYYPQLSHQVIVLPTNAEIDERKLGVLEKRVAQHYTIVNDSGESARIEGRPLVEAGA